MTGPVPAVAAVRLAVRRALAASAEPGQTVLVACSGGADSLALAAATAFEAPRLGLRAGAVTVDHGLQPGSAEIAGTAAGQARVLGLDPVLVRRVGVTGPGGPEAAARRARYAAVREVMAGHGVSWVLLGHTRDDQAETVLLGLGRGSGPRSVAGMRPVDPPWLRPLLDVGRDATADACRAQGLTPWQDPHNADPRFTRVRLRREVLPLLEDVLGGGVAAALARTAALLRDDLDALDSQAARLVDELVVEPAAEPGVGPLLDEPVEPAAGPSVDGAPGSVVPVVAVAGLPSALRGRVLRGWLTAAGVPGITSAHLRAVSALVVKWHGQGPVGLPGGWRAYRRDGHLRVSRPRGRTGMPLR